MAHWVRWPRSVPGTRGRGWGATRGAQGLTYLTYQPLDSKPQCEESHSPIICVLESLGSLVRLHVLFKFTAHPALFPAIII